MSLFFNGINLRYSECRSELSGFFKEKREEKRAKTHDIYGNLMPVETDFIFFLLRLRILSTMSVLL